MTTRETHKSDEHLRTSDRFVFRELIRLVVDNLWFIVGVAAAVTLLAGIYCIFASPVYSADALVQVEVPKQNELADLVSKQPAQTAVPSNGPPTNTEIAIIRSRAVLAPVIAQNGLDVEVKPRTVPVLGKFAAAFTTSGEPSKPWFGLSGYAWGGEVIDIAQFDVPTALQDKKLDLKVLDAKHYQLFDNRGKLLLEGAEGQLAEGNGIVLLVKTLVAPTGVHFSVERLNELTAVTRFSDHLKIAEIGKETGIVQISFENGDAALAAAVTNSIADNYVASHLTRDQQEASNMLAFINGELPKLRDNLKLAEHELQKHRVDSGSMQASTESQSYLQGSIEFAKQIATLDLQRTSLRDRFTDHSDQVKTIDAQLAELHAAQGKFESRFNAMPGADRQSVDLERDAKVAEDIYVAMVNKAHELSVSRASTAGNVRVIDPAVEPSSPIKPQRAVTFAAAPIPGLFLGVLLVIALRFFSQSVSEPEQVEGRLRLKMLGSVPLSNRQADEELNVASLQLVGGETKPAVPRLKRTDGPLAAKRPDDRTIEVLRRVRTMLDASLHVSEDRVVAITGATSSTGKTFISANLAVLYAQAGKRVLLVDTDLRRGRLASLFGLSERAEGSGLADLLGGDATLQRAVHRTGIPNLSLLPAGTRPAHPAELLAMAQLPKLLDDLAERYDLVLVDTPPVLAVTDALIVARHAGATVLVLRENAQTEQEVEETLRLLEGAGARVQGAIFNGMSLRRSDRRSLDYLRTYTSETNVSAI